MQRAKAMGIDAFALNIGTDTYTDTQLDYAYKSAANNGMKVFISFDFNWYHAATDAAVVGQKIATFAKYPAQLKIGTKSFASSFAGDGFNSAAMRSAAGIEVFWAPNFTPNSDVNQVDAAFNWIVSLFISPRIRLLNTYRLGTTTATTRPQALATMSPSRRAMLVTSHG